MADLNYNPGAQRPTLDVPGLSGMWAARDRQAYDQQTQLSQLMGQQKFSEYMQDAPVRESARGSNIATNRATEATIMGQKQGESDRLELENKYNRGTLSARMGQGIAEAGQKEQGAALAKMQQGLGYAAMMTQALGQYGPAGASHVLQTLRQRGINVENDPVVNYVMSASDPKQMQSRITEVHSAFNMASQEFRTSQMREQEHTQREILAANSRVTVAGIRQPGEKEHDETVKAFATELKEANPTWSSAKVQAEAFRAYQRGRYGAQKLEDSETQAQGKLLAERNHIWHLTDGKLGTPPKNTMKGAVPYSDALDTLRKDPSAANKAYFKTTYGVDADTALNYGR